MIHNKFRYLLTLVALFALTAGAWADETVFEYADPMVGTLTQGTTGTSATTVKIHNNSTTVNAIKFSNSYVYADGKYITIAPSSGSFKKGDVVSIAGCISTSTPEAYAKAGIYTADGATQLYETANVINGRDTNDDPEVETYTMTQDAEKLLIARSTGTTALFITTLKVVRTASDPAGTALTPDATRKIWTLDKMPAGNVELQVEYYPGMLTLGNAIEGGKLEVVGMGLGTTSFTAPDEWFKNSTKLASSHFEGFKGVTEEEAKAWPGVPATGMVALFYNYDETAQKWDMIYFKDGAFHAIYKGEPQQLATIYNLLDANFSVFYTTGMQMPAGFEKDEEGNIYVEPGTKFQVKAVPDEGFHLASLTDGTNTYEVDADGIATITMPDADFALTATFSDEYTVALNAEGLSEAEAAAWKAATGDKDPAALPLENVKYGTEVKVTYTGTKKVIGVKAAKKKAEKTITIGDVELIYADGDTWETIVSKNSDKITIRAGGYIVQVEQPAPNQYRYLKVVLSTNKVNPSDIIDPSKKYEWDTIEVYS